MFIMAFAALTGAVSRFAIGGLPDFTVWALCVVFTLLWARVAAVFANRAQPKTLNRATGVVLVILGAVIMEFNGYTNAFIALQNSFLAEQACETLAIHGRRCIMKLQ